MTRLDIQGMKHAWDGQRSLGILRWDYEEVQKYWGLRPWYSLTLVPQNPLQDSQVPLSNPGLFHTLDANTKPWQIIIALYGFLTHYKSPIKPTRSYKEGLTKSYHTKVCLFFASALPLLCLCFASALPSADLKNFIRPCGRWRLTRPHKAYEWSKKAFSGLMGT